MRRGLRHCGWDVGAHRGGSHVRASTQHGEAALKADSKKQRSWDLGPALKLSCHATLADSLPTLVLSFPTCTMGLVTVFRLWFKSQGLGIGQTWVLPLPVSSYCNSGELGGGRLSASISPFVKWV